MGFHWSTHQLTEYLAAVSASPEEDVAVRVAVERAVEALDAEVGALAVAGATDVRGLIGLPPPLPASAVAPVLAGATASDLPGIGPVHAAYAALGSGIDGGLIVARIDDALSVEERQMLQGMAQVLGLALRNLRTLAVERSLREEREREAAHRLELLEVVRARQALVETLFAIQRSISKREPLQSVLDAITAGASSLLGGAAIALVLADPSEPASLIITSTSHWPTTAGAAAAAVQAAADSMVADETIGHADERAGIGRLHAAPVHVSGAIAGSLVAILPDAPNADEDPAGLLSALAQQISMALTDARTVEAMREAYRDPLTGLPNRKLFLERLEHVLADGQAGQVVVLFIDLDRFKAVNDSLGHRAGDELLAAVAGRLRASLRASDVAARLGGDEFGVVLEGVSVEDARQVAERIATEIAEPFPIAGRRVYIGASIGIAPCQWDRVGAAELLGNADVAMYRAKKVRSGKVVVFESGMHSEALSQLEFQADLQNALTMKQFRLAYQPLFRLDTGDCVGAETLLRWRHPERGEVSPEVFIPAAEEIGLINDLGQWVLREAVFQLAAWRRVHPDLGLSVNVSAREIVNPCFAPRVADTLAAARVPGDALTVELTETALLTDPATALSHLRALKAAGVRISIDDFGTGYSSLSHLRHFPVDEVKIDRSFVAGVGRSSTDEAVVRAIIDLGRALRLRVVAEGIEEAAQARVLAKLGCHLAQGYYLCRPMAPADCGEFLLQRVAPVIGARARRQSSQVGLVL